MQAATSFALAGDNSTTGDEPIFSYSLSIGSLFIYTVILLVTWGIARLYPNPRETLGLRPFPGRYIGYAATSSSSRSSSQRSSSRSSRPARSRGSRRRNGRQAGWHRSSSTRSSSSRSFPFTEELFFRGLGVSVLSRFGPLVAILGTAIVFGLAHGLLVALPALVLFAVGLAWLRLHSDSVWPGVAAHAAFNAIGLAAAAIAAG